jgi:1-(5-phosphoribosyl)-5-[(5-phosphoribosylamino)methylideneamino]imidazole-4-carboxamide isomerase
MIILPAIDIIGGRCVRLSQGDYNQQTQYEATPVDMVKQYVAHGFKRIHVVDLDGAKASSPQNLDTLSELAAVPGAEIEWGGGIKSVEALGAVLDAGAKYAVVGSVAAKQPELFEQWLRMFGPERIVLGADVREGRVAVNGWQEEMDVTIDDLVDRFLKYGLSQVICTDISRDGMLQGPATELYVRLQKKYPKVDFTVSGGISSMADIHALKAAHLRRVIVGKAIYEGRITLDELYAK